MVLSSVVPRGLVLVCCVLWCCVMFSVVYCSVVEFMRFQVIDASKAFRSGTLSIDQARCLQRICGSYSFHPGWARLLMPLDDVDMAVEASCSDCVANKLSAKRGQRRVQLFVAEGRIACCCFFYPLCWCVGLVAMERNASRGWCGRVPHHPVLALRSMATNLTHQQSG